MRGKEMLFKIWLAPRWSHYAVTLAAVICCTIIRILLDPVLGDSIQLVWFTIPVAIACFVGGLMPGMLGITLSMVIGVNMFVVGSEQWNKNPTLSMIGVASFGAIWLFICFVCDIMRNTAIGFRQVARERDQSESRFVSILSGISDGFCAVSRDFEVLHTNRAFRDLLGLQEDVNGASLWSLLSEKSHPAIRSQLDLALATGKPVLFDDQITTDERYFHIRGFPNHQGLFVYVQDVTARRDLEMRREELLDEERKARSEAEEANRLKDEFVATVSHELRTPLTTILGWSELLGRKAQNNPDYGEGLAIIERSTRLQAQLIEDLLDVSRLTTGKLRLDLEVMDLSEVISDAVKAARSAAALKDIQIVSNLGADEVFIKGDASRLGQVVSNLISNALKFSPENQEVTVALTTSEDKAIITVTDRGIGIDAENMPIIFDRFRQANASITRKHGGLGLGLAIVKQITELHGGEVGAESEGLGKGSTFRVVLPLTKMTLPTGLPIPRQESLAKIEGLNILVVDDDDATRTLLTALLTDSGANVISAPNAGDALRELEETSPEIIVSDIGMPDMDGYEFMKTVRDRGLKIPSIALTAFSRDEDRKRALASGFQEHMAKPIDVDRLLSTILKLSETATP